MSIAKNFITNVIGNFGIIIIILVILLRIVLLPLSYRSYLSMAKMKALKPELDEIKNKVGDDMTKVQQEQLKLYQQAGVNPLSGCIPILLQMPILFAFFNLLTAAVELRGAPWMLWIADLSSKDPYYVLPIVMGATQWLQVRMSPQAGDPLQQALEELAADHRGDGGQLLATVTEPGQARRDDVAHAVRHRQARRRLVRRAVGNDAHRLDHEERVALAQVPELLRESRDGALVAPCADERPHEHRRLRLGERSERHLRCAVLATELLEHPQIHAVGLPGAAVGLRERQPGEVHRAELVVEITRERARAFVGTGARGEPLHRERADHVEQGALLLGETHVSTGARSSVLSRSHPSSVTTTMSSMRIPNAPGTYTPGSIEKVIPGSSGRSLPATM